MGGLTVARRVRELLPNAPLLYFADTAHVPYGDRTPGEVRHYALSISDFLIERGARIVVFACNTSSAYALDQARARFSVPVVGMIEPGAKAALAVSRGGSIGVLATHATVESGVYSRTLGQLSPGVECHEIACPEFVPLVESEQTLTAAAHDAAWRYLTPLIQSGADTIILGCTHYPLLLPVLGEAAAHAGAPHLVFVDPAQAVAGQVAALARDFTSRSSRDKHDVFYVSGPQDGVGHWIEKLLPQRPAADLRVGPVFDVPNDG